MRVQLVKGNTNYRYFNGDADNNSGQFEDYFNDIVMITGQVQRKIWRRIYQGFMENKSPLKLILRHMAILLTSKI